ncbi:ER membrane protein complex subunit 4 [Choanephora cucurbitarum]|uniref:ER membrane protein complex subunit 4 n=1 Tax=Choanephora cucurbitarum TaxID=101091 RepID=A0A1C7NA25_9FUNG|nr:ER membrane protein complex subunit 4 [Choanephora cucurbitarum]
MSNWSIDYASLSPSNNIKLANPVGFEPSALQKYTKHEKTQGSINQAERDEQQVAIKIKRAWDVAMAPAKSIPMNAVMIYMSGSSLQIFTVMVTVMLFLTPIKAIMSVQQTFSRFETTDAKPGANLWMPKLTFIGLHFVTILLGIYKVNVMGLLPTTVSDWLAFIPPKQVLEFAA